MSSSRPRTRGETGGRPGNKTTAGGGAGGASGGGGGACGAALRAWQVGSMSARRSHCKQERAKSERGTHRSAANGAVATADESGGAGNTSSVRLGAGSWGSAALRGGRCATQRGTAGWRRRAVLLASERNAPPLRRAAAPTHSGRAACMATTRHAPGRKALRVALAPRGHVGSCRSAKRGQQDSDTRADASSRECPVSRPSCLATPPIRHRRSHPARVCVSRGIVPAGGSGVSRASRDAAPPQDAQA